MKQELPRVVKAGRPKLQADQPTKFIGFKADGQTKHRLDSAAKHLNLNNSDIIRLAVTDFLDNYEKEIA